MCEKLVSCLYYHECVAHLGIGLVIPRSTGDNSIAFSQIQSGFALQYSPYLRALDLLRQRVGKNGGSCTHKVSPLLALPCMPLNIQADELSLLIHIELSQYHSIASV